MRALLLAAGFGSRLAPLTDHTPKCLVEIGGRPLLDYWLDAVFEAGYERALVNTHHLAEKVERYLAQSRWHARIDAVHEPSMLGTGGTVLANADYFGGQTFLVAHADNLTDLDLGKTIETHRARPRGCVMTMATFRTDQPQSAGILELDDAGIVRAFHEKIANPPGNLANAAVYVFEPEVITAIRSLRKNVVDLSTEIIPMFMGRILAFEHKGYHRDIGTPESLALGRAEFPQVLAARHSK